AVVAVLGARRPHLLAVQHPRVPVPDRRGLQAGHVGAGAWLGEQLAPDLIAAQHRRQVALLLFLAAALQDRRAGHAQADDECADGQRVVPRFLAEGDLLKVGEPLAAVLGGPGDAGEPGVVEPGLEVFLGVDAHPAAGLLGVLPGRAARRVLRQPRAGAAAKFLCGLLRAHWTPSVRRGRGEKLKSVMLIAWLRAN